MTERDQAADDEYARALAFECAVRELVAEYAAECAAIDKAHPPPPAVLTPNMGLRSNFEGIDEWMRDRQAAYARYQQRLAALTASEGKPL